jgi:hypothetical protein
VDSSIVTIFVNFYGQTGLDLTLEDLKDSWMFEKLALLQ